MSLQPRKLANVFGFFTPPTGTSLENTPQAIDWIEICMTKDESNIYIYICVCVCV